MLLFLNIFGENLIWHFRTSNTVQRVFVIDPLAVPHETKEEIYGSRLSRDPQQKK